MKQTSKHLPDPVPANIFIFLHSVTEKRTACRPAEWGGDANT
jgi:hypothetical protein